jgi:hypothetical protein
VKTYASTQSDVMLSCFEREVVNVEFVCSNTKIQAGTMQHVSISYCNLRKYLILTGCNMLLRC